MPRTLHFLLHISGPVFLMALFSCTNLPESEYYEAGGTVSVKVSALHNVHGWIPTDLPLTRSLVSSDTARVIPVRFYLQNPGDYWISILAGSENDDNDSLQFGIRVTDHENFLLGMFSPEAPRSDIPEWISENSGGEQMQVRFNQQGFYTITLDPAGRERLILDALHLTLENKNPPTGTGYPVTAEPNADPVFQKREQAVAIPPARAFGVIAGRETLLQLTGREPDLDLSLVPLTQQSDSEPESQISRLKMIFDQTRSTDNEQLSPRGFVLLPAPPLITPEFKRYPALRFSRSGKSGFDELQEQVLFLSDPDLPAYEIPFFAPMPRWAAGDERTAAVPSQELLQRWIQLSALSPVMVLPLPTAYQVSGAGNPAFTVSDETLDQIQKYSDLRRQLFPFLYSYTLRARTSGVKTVTAAEGLPGAFLYGEELLVVPVTEEGLRQMPVRFPDGSWYDLWSGERYEGGRTWIIDLSPEELPLFVKAGSIIPQRPEPSLVEQGSGDSLQVDIYTGGVSSFRLYEDDGKTLEYLNGDFTTTAFRWFEQEREDVFTIGAMVWGRGEYRRQTRYTLRFKFMDRPEKITANGEPLPLGEGEGAWSYSERDKAVTLRWIQPSNLRTEFRFVHRGGHRNR